MYVSRFVLYNNNLGALFETGAEFPMYIPYDDYKRLAKKFAAGIEAAAESLESEAINEHLKFQRTIPDKYYNWNKQGLAWNRFLEGAINACQ